MLLSRGINFYLFMIISGIFVAFLFLKGKKPNKNDSKWDVIKYKPINIIIKNKFTWE